MVHGSSWYKLYAGKTFMCIPTLELTMIAPIDILFLRLFIAVLRTNDRLKSGKGLSLISILTPLLSTHHSLARWQVDCTDTRLDLIDVLPTLSAAADLQCKCNSK